MEYKELVACLRRSSTLGTRGWCVGLIGSLSTASYRPGGFCASRIEAIIAGHEISPTSVSLAGERVNFGIVI